MKIYAKSETKETLREHTNRLLHNYESLRKNYPHACTPRAWELLRIVICYHDAGKVYTPFQNRIRKNLNEDPIPTEAKYDIPHNYLSIAFVPLVDLRVKYRLTPGEERALMQSIVYHHERKKTLDIQEVRDAISMDLCNHAEAIAQELGVPVNPNMKIKPNYSRKYWKIRIEKDDPEYFLYVQLKGMLHRLDHASSALEKVEMHSTYSIGEATQSYLQNKEIRELQLFTQQNQEENLFIVAQTGLGKTEAALLWIGKEKGFFTLPLRVSLNGLYDRVTSPQKIGFIDEKGKSIAGLLHSRALEHLESKAEEKSIESEGFELSIRQARLLSRKLTFTTIDQVLKFPFLFQGYEKWYSSFRYTKLVIDEIQSYSPRIVAVLMKALEMIHQIGGRFMVMTATMPSYFIEELQTRKHIPQSAYKLAHFQNDLLRHRIQIRRKKILDEVETIANAGKLKKVLVICNTVKQSIRVYEALYQYTKNVSLLHSEFTLEDRQKLEKEIVEFAPSQERNPESGIWVTTQLVEASLDVDFDVLYTELSTLDSFIQRIGRVFRSRTNDLDITNVYLFTEEVGTIYDRDLLTLSLQALEPYQDTLMDEKTKANLVAEVYQLDRIKETRFYQEFQLALEQLDLMTSYTMQTKEAQKILREIESITVLPKIYCDQLYDVFQEYQDIDQKVKQARKDKDYEELKRMYMEKQRLRKIIEKKTISVRSSKLYSMPHVVSRVPFDGFETIQILDIPYESIENNEMRRGILWGEDDLFLD